jgi:hypothetical protein
MPWYMWIFIGVGIVWNAFVLLALVGLAKMVREARTNAHVIGEAMLRIATEHEKRVGVVEHFLVKVFGLERAAPSPPDDPAGSVRPMKN